MSGSPRGPRFVAVSAALLASVPGTAPAHSIGRRDAAFFRNVVFDGNLHWQRTDSAPLIRWGTPSYATLQAFTAATGQEVNGLEQQPLFELDGVTPAVGGAMRDRAIPLPGINDRLADGMPDIGAIEAP